MNLMFLSLNLRKLRFAALVSVLQMQMMTMMMFFSELLFSARSLSWMNLKSKWNWKIPNMKNLNLNHLMKTFGFEKVFL